MRHEEFFAATVSSSKYLLPPPATGDLPESWAPMVHGLHRIAYTEWGPRDAHRTVVCAHGFTRNGRDFDVLADTLSKRFRVVCLDFAGRGSSDWLVDPSADAGYNLWQNLLDALSLIARLGTDRVDWVGTSMGGLVGMMLASLPSAPVHQLVLNDVGCVVPGEFLRHLAGYVSKDPDFEDLNEVEQYMRTIYDGFGALTDEQWQQLARNGSRRKSTGTLGLAFDPLIGKGVTEPFADVDMRWAWLKVGCPVLLLRGEKSTALSQDIAEEMTRTGPQARLVEIPNVGHAPMLMSPAQTGLVETWLETGQLH